MSITGRCHCQKTKYEAQGDPQFQFFCHCTDCRKLFCGGHLSGIALSREGFESEGDLSSYRYPGGSGKDVHSYFCGNCGTPLYAFLDEHPGTVVLRANSLDDEKLYKPQKSIFEKSAFAWDRSVIT